MFITDLLTLINYKECKHEKESDRTERGLEVDQLRMNTSEVSSSQEKRWTLLVPKWRSEEDSKNGPNVNSMYSEVLKDRCANKRSVQHLRSARFYPRLTVSFASRIKLRTV